MFRASRAGQVGALGEVAVRLHLEEQRGAGHTGAGSQPECPRHFLGTVNCNTESGHKLTCLRKKMAKVGSGLAGSSL